MDVFSIEVEGFFESRFGFQRWFYVFAAGHFVFFCRKKFEISGGPVIDFPWCSKFFVIQDCFSMKSIGF